MTDEVAGPPKRRRIGRGRSKTGCLTCRTRKIKCDEDRPQCAHCLRINVSCSYAKRIQPAASKLLMILPNQWETLTEGETFHRFVFHVAPILGRYYNLDFWTTMVPQAAQSQDQILNATLAVTTLYDIPVSGNAAISANISKRYQTAIDWYCRSVREVSGSGPQGEADVRSLLICSILYLYAELRHMDWQNLERIILSAFAIIYASRHELWNRKDETLRTCLMVLMDLSISTAIDSSRISRAHRQFAIILTLKISADLDTNELHQLKLEAISMMLDFNDLFSIDGFGEEDLENDMNMDQRLSKWQQSLIQFDETPDLDIVTRMTLIRSEVLYLTCLVRYDDYQAGQFNRERVETSLERLLYLFSRGAQFFHRVGTSTIIDAIHVNFVAGCMFIPWFWRHSAIIAKVSTVLNSFAESSPDLVRESLGYMETLINTSRTRSTQLEVDLFGTKPLKTILYWQQQRCANRLALLSRKNLNSTRVLHQDDAQENRPAMPKIR